MKLPTAIAALSLLPLAMQRQEAQEAPVPAPTTVIQRDGCVTSECHSAVKGYAHLHGPLNVNACDSCHRLVDPGTHAFEMARPPQQLCLLCHEFNLTDEVMLHKPLETGDCLPCHDPHGGTTSNLLRGRNYGEMCSSCHEDLVAAKLLLHGPASAGECGACHEPHASPNRMLLSAEGTTLCLRCHIVTGTQLETLYNVHTPARIDCRLCHDPHATDHDSLLTDDPVALCTSCHSGIHNALNSTSIQHAAVTTGRACLNCHDPHASDHPKLLKSDTMTLCFECHDQPLDLLEGGTIVDIKSRIESSRKLHGPTERGGCGACHQVHGSNYPRLLESEYSTNLYLPYRDSIYEMCFLCHDRQMVMMEQTPVLTSFRNGSTNLHYLHVHRAEKGRSCRICHDAHGTNNDHHLRDAVDFGPGGWMLPIAWSPTPAGGLCQVACHPAYEYNRNEPISYPPRSGRDSPWRGNDLNPDAGAQGGRDPDPAPLEDTIPDGNTDKTQQRETDRE